VNRTVLLNVVALTPSLIGRHTPRIADFAARRRVVPLVPSLPAVTSTVQASFLTGTSPQRHGIVANGWYSREDGDVRLWRRSNAHVAGEKIWEIGRRRDGSFTCANLCFMHAMFSSCDWTVAARPMYPADGRKLPDCYGKPNELRHALQRDLGTFPLFRFWGPATTIESTRWIADAAIWIDHHHAPTLSLVYLPHLDYVLQRQGPDADAAAADLRELDEQVGKLIDHFERRGVTVAIASEYGIEAVDRPVHLNRVLREAGLLAIRDELGRDHLEPADSVAFAVADHQVAHVYCNDPDRIESVQSLLEKTPGVARVYAGSERAEVGLDHPRSGELVAFAERGAWFTYYYWLDESRRPDFATTVDIHRKPGYDPAELFIDPGIRHPKLKLAGTLALRKLGMRALMSLTPTNGELVRGSHGLEPADREHGPVWIGSREPAGETVSASDVCRLLLAEVFGA
jgi:predicted AlkP superfamily pyrophosphatase or phosphodiesterase